MTASTNSVDLASPSVSPGAVRAVPKPIAWWLAGGLGIVGASALAAAMATGPKSDLVPEKQAPSKVVASTGKAGKTRASTDRNLASAAVCSACGVVEGIKSEKRKGEGTGIGAVAGGVLGGVVGHQMGGGNGKKAMTVLGAVGGGLAGHEIEKQARSVTVYQVQLRMDDGSIRTLTQTAAPAMGARFEVDGNKLKPLPAKA